MKRLAAACLAAPLLMAACNLVELDGLRIESPEIGIVIGDTLRMDLLRRDGSIPSPEDVRWTSSDPSVAVVDETGLVTGTGAGWVQIRAQLAGFGPSTPLRVWALAPPFADLAAGAAHACGLDEEGRAWCWGLDDHGQIGNTGQPDQCRWLANRFAPCSKAARPVSTDQRFAQLALGYYHSCGLTAGGTAYCWGSNERGELGDGGTRSRPNPQPVSGGQVFESLAAGANGTCGITAEGALLCWGSSNLGALGTWEAPVTTPVHVAPEHRFRSVAVTGDHSCGLTLASGTVCWGLNQHGQLGADIESSCPDQPDLPCTLEPTEVQGAPPFTALAVNLGFTCGLGEDGRAWCWGSNERGELGDGRPGDSARPVPVLGERSFSRIVTTWSQACGVEAPGGGLFCWGRDALGFGTGQGPVLAREPVPVAPELAFTAVSLALGYACGVAATGVTWCWGQEVLGLLGTGKGDWRPEPVGFTMARVVRQ